MNYLKKKKNTHSQCYQRQTSKEQHLICLQQQECVCMQFRWNSQNSILTLCRHKQNKKQNRKRFVYYVLLLLLWLLHRFHFTGCYLYNCLLRRCARERANTINGNVMMVEEDGLAQCHNGHQYYDQFTVLSASLFLVFRRLYLGQPCYCCLSILHHHHDWIRKFGTKNSQTQTKNSQ